MISLTQSRYLVGYCLEDFWTGVLSCEEGGDYDWLHSAIYPISCGITNYELGYGQYVYNDSGGVEGALNCVCV